MKKLLVASTSTVHGKGYLEYILPELSRFFKGISELVFIPYAQPGGISYDDYTQLVKNAFEKINIQVVGVHEYNNPLIAIQNAKAIFVGGGNTFLLLKKLYDIKLIAVLKSAVENGTPYFGTSAGSNIVGVSIQNTNDMPIVYPPSFNALGLLHFNLNPHYLDPDPNSKHMGETRETRIKEFHSINNIPVLGLREGSWLEVKGSEITLKGNLHARLFIQNTMPKEIPGDTAINFLM